VAEPLTINVAQAAVNAPAVYTVPSSTSVEPLAAFARYDGTAAGSAFLPALTFYSTAGLILARVFPDTQVAAGGTADVTFAPFLGSTGAGGTTTGAFSNVASVTTQSVPSGVETFLTFDLIGLNANNLSTVDNINFKIPGTGPFPIYEITVYAQMLNNPALAVGNWTLRGGVVDPEQAYVYVSGTLATDRTYSISVTGPQDIFPGDTINARIKHDTGVAADVGRRSIAVTYLGQWQ
jgi:hypothetical protein